MMLAIAFSSFHRLKELFRHIRNLATFYHLLENWKAIWNILISPLSQPIIIQLPTSSLSRFNSFTMALKQSENLQIFTLLDMKHDKIIAVRHVNFLAISLRRVKHEEVRIVLQLNGCR